MPPRLGAAADDGAYAAVAAALLAGERVVLKVGGGARAAGAPLTELLELADAVAVTSPLVSGTIPYAHPRNMTVGGSKGSISGNAPVDREGAGTYEVNEDCPGTHELQIVGSPIKVIDRFVIVDRGREVRNFVVSPALFMVTGVSQKIGR